MTAPRTEATLETPLETPITTSTTQQEPGTNPSPSTEGNVDTTTQNLFMAALRERENENVALRNQIAALQNRTPSTTQTTPEEAWNQFTSDPRALIRSEVQETVAPLNQFIAAFNKEKEIEKVKRMYRAVPQYKPVFDYAENELDNILMNAPQINTQTMELALMTVAGAIATGRIKVEGFNYGQPTPTPTPTPTPRPQNLPPNPPRSTPTPPVPTHGTEASRELTESERRLARHFKMTDAEYLAGLSESTMVVKTGAK